MEKQEFAELIKETLKNEELANALCDETGVSLGTLGRWSRGSSPPECVRVRVSNWLNEQK